MGSQVGTIIIEPRLLVRQALAALMENLSYRVVCSVKSTTDIACSLTIADERKLVILGAPSAEDAAEQAINVRKLWPDCKIMLLFEAALTADLQRLLTSQIDGFLPLFVSSDTLRSMLDLIITQDFRVMIVGDMKHGTVKPVLPEADKPLSSVIGDDVMSVVADAEPRTGLQVDGAGSGDATVVCGTVEKVSSARNSRLSEREGQILDGLVKGDANKVIARRFDIAEATVKVHMKSILRKIRVANRTQAAIWALENGYCAREAATTLRLTR